MNEAKHIGWLNTEPRTKVFVGKPPAERSGGHCWIGDGKQREDNIVLQEPRHSYYSATEGVREWPEFTPVEKMDQCDLCNTPVVRGDSYPQTDERGTRQVCRKCFASACGMEPTPGGVSDTSPGTPAYPGLEYAGTCYGTRVYAGDADEARKHHDPHLSLMTKPENCEQRSADGGLLVAGNFKRISTSHEGLAVFATWVKWDHRVSGKPREVQRSTGLLPDADSTPAASPGEPTSPAPAKLSKTLDDLVYKTGRKQTWGDMRTEREPKGGPILTCGDPGHVRLYLERLSDDRKRAMSQLTDAQIEMAKHVGPWPKPLATRLNCLGVAVHMARNAIDVGWKLEPYLQAIRDAHEAVGMEREWQEGKVRTQVHRETLAPGNSPGETRVVETGQPKPGWGKR